MAKKFAPRLDWTRTPNSTRKWVCFFSDRLLIIGTQIRWQIGCGAVDLHFFVVCSPQSHDRIESSMSEAPRISGCRWVFMMRRG